MEGAGGGVYVLENWRGRRGVALEVAEIFMWLEGGWNLGTVDVISSDL